MGNILWSCKYNEKMTVRTKPQDTQQKRCNVLFSLTWNFIILVQC